MHPTLARLAALRDSNQSDALIHDWCGLEDYYRSRRFFVRKAAEALTSALILRDCAQHRGEPTGAYVAAALQRAAAWRRQAMEVTYAI